MDRPANAHLILISKDYHAPYSGMLPGYVAGHYTFDECHINVRPLARFADCAFYHDRVTGIDLDNRLVVCHERPPVPFDLLSINTGSTPKQTPIPGAMKHALPVKPVDRFLAGWKDIEQRIAESEKPFRIVTVGGGAGGVELTLSVQHRLTSQQNAAHTGAEFHIVTGTSRILPTHNKSVRSRMERVLRERGVSVHTNSRVIEVRENEVVCENDETILYDALLWVTDAAPAPWIRESGLDVDDGGFMLVDQCLRSTSHPSVLGAGDAVTMEHAVRPKSGVFAVRQGPYLARNLRNSINGHSLASYRPQRQFLSLISTGDKNAIASRGPFSFEGRFIWRWKDSIDRRFMEKYNDLPEMDPESMAPESRAHGEMRCAGCGAKAGSQLLHRTLRTLKQRHKGVVVGLDAPDDAAVVEVPPNTLSVQTVDFFPAIIEDPYVLGRITANHCLNDIYAMGATPQTALAMVTLPHGSTPVQEHLLHDVLAGTVRELEDAGAVLAGGHTSEGPDLVYGLSVNGYVKRDAMLRKAGMRTGDALVLTKPIGTGALFAADMRLEVKGRWIESVVASMTQSNRAAADCLRKHGATACTDVTGFGLAGHLVEMLQASNAHANLQLEQVHLLPGALEVTLQGIRSSLYPENNLTQHYIAVDATHAQNPAFPLLFDPQTSGGLLAGIPKENAPRCVEELCDMGYEDAAIIGEVREAMENGALITLM